MQSYRLVLVMCLALMSLGLVTAAAALAAPEFSPSTTQSFTGSSSSGKLTDSLGEEITCTADSSTGEINGVDTVGKVVVTFTGCTGKKTSKETACSVHSTGAAAGEIKTSSLKGELGEVATTEAASGVGLDLEPEKQPFVTIEKATCATGATVEGSIAGEVTPIKKLQATGELIFTQTANGTQKIKTITVLSGSKKPALLAFGLVAASEETTEKLSFTKAVEVT